MTTMGDRLNPYDGFRVEVELDPNDKVVRLFLELKLGGKRFEEPVLVGTFDSDSPGQAQALRLEHVMRAACRYINSGGDVDALFLPLCGPFYSYLKEHQLQLPKELELVAFGDSDEGFQYIFENASSETFTVITEDCYAEELVPDELFGALQEYHERRAG